LSFEQASELFDFIRLPFLVFRGLFAFNSSQNAQLYKKVSCQNLFDQCISACGKLFV